MNSFVTTFVPRRGSPARNDCYYTLINNYQKTLNCKFLGLDIELKIFGFAKNTGVERIRSQGIVNCVTGGVSMISATGGVSK